VKARGFRRPSAAFRSADDRVTESELDSAPQFEGLLQLLALLGCLLRADSGCRGFDCCSDGFCSCEASAWVTVGTSAEQEECIFPVGFVDLPDVTWV